MFESVRPDPGSDGLTRAARIFYVLAVLGGIITALRLLGFFGSPFGIGLAGLLMSAACAILAFVTARGIENQRPWAKNLAYAQGFLSLLNLPIGPIIGIAILIYVSRASKAGLFSA